MLHYLTLLGKAIFITHSFEKSEGLMDLNACVLLKGNEEIYYSYNEFSGPSFNLDAYHRTIILHIYSID